MAVVNFTMRGNIVERMLEAIFGEDVVIKAVKKIQREDQLSDEKKEEFERDYENNRPD